MLGGSWEGAPGCHMSLVSPPQTSQPTLDTFQELLHKHPDVFYPSRTAKALQLHWQLMKQYYLLSDQTGELGGSLCPPPPCPLHPPGPLPSPPASCSLQCSRCPRETKC